jgi:hypothetical protein
MNVIYPKTKSGKRQIVTCNMRHTDPANRKEIFFVFFHGILFHHTSLHIDILTIYHNEPNLSPWT